MRRTQKTTGSTQRRNREPPKPDSATCSPLAPTDASILPSGLQGQKSATRRLVKLLQSNWPTSAEKLPDFTAEVDEVLSCVFLTSRKEVVFLALGVWIPFQRSADVTSRLHPTFCPVAAVEATVADGFGNVVALDFFAAFQVGNGACHLQDAAIGTGTEFETFHSHA